MYNIYIIYAYIYIYIHIYIHIRTYMHIYVYGIMKTTCPPCSCTSLLGHITYGHMSYMSSHKCMSCHKAIVVITAGLVVFTIPYILR